MFAAPNTFFTAVGKLTTVTFTANGTWVAPANVSLVTTLSGKGSDGVSDSTSGSSLSDGYVARITGSTTGTSHDWSELYNPVSAWVSSVNTGSGVISSIATPHDNGGRIGDTDLFPSGAINWTTGSTVTETNVVRGSASISYNSFPSNSGTITTSAVNSVKTSTGDYPHLTMSWTTYNYGYAGTDATALGQTLPGGAYVAPTGYPATTTTYTNVSVTPGASYSIVVPSGGTVSISYYA